ncbi:MAG: leucyl/phenylalanyl-tRNA--protein transferase [Alphaproteobacteria bacterium]|nr:leucyl/phenylalanyl-tRNA--protein transferase [Alphaproteobacteria bacterium]
MVQNPEITPELVLGAYTLGLFPMAPSASARELYWFNPEKRGVLPLAEFHMPRSLRKFLHKHPFTYSADMAFEQVIQACAEVNEGRKDTWINPEIIALYCELARRGHAHSIETWQDGKLVGGLYGVSLGGAFFGESMFSRATNASKAALTVLVQALRRAGFTLLDTQFLNRTLAQFGAVEISRENYMQQLEEALAADIRFPEAGSIMLYI